VKSRRGRPKRIPTEGFACQEPTCRYRGIADAHIHALVGDGTQGRHEPIQTFRCQACGTTFTARRDTPLYRLKTPAGRVGEVLTALAEGVELAAVALNELGKGRGLRVDMPVEMEVAQDAPIG
jgi:hypothetical protein